MGRIDPTKNDATTGKVGQEVQYVRSHRPIPCCTTAVPMTSCRSSRTMPTGMPRCERSMPAPAAAAASPTCCPTTGRQSRLTIGSTSCRTTCRSSPTVSTCTKHQDEYFISDAHYFYLGSQSVVTTDSHFFSPFFSLSCSASCSPLGSMMWTEVHLSRQMIAETTAKLPRPDKLLQKLNNLRKQLRCNDVLWHSIADYFPITVFFLQNKTIVR